MLPRLLPIAAISTLAALALPAAAQHPMPPRDRALHARLALADVVAVGTIGTIHEGRVEIRDAVVLRGDAPASFEIKRSPSAPPPFVTGVNAVLLLRGARPPYVLVDESREIVLPPDAAAAKRWTEALRALFAAASDPVALLHTYLVWLDGDDELLRDAAGAALSETNAPYLPLGRDDAIARARAALDPGRTPPARRVSAGLAISHPDGAAALVAGTPGDAPDPQVIAIALRATAGVARESRDAALLRSLDHETVDVRRAAVLSAASLWSDPIAARLQDMATSDPDADVKLDAIDVMSRMNAAP